MVGGAQDLPVVQRIVIRFWFVIEVGPALMELTRSGRGFQRADDGWMSLPLWPRACRTS